MKVGILTGGGDCPGLNAVLRAVVRTCTRDDVGARVVGIRDGFLGLIQGRASPLNEEGVSGILPRGGTILGSSNRDDPFDFDGVIDGHPARGDMTERVVANYRALGLDALIVVGGDGTQSIALRLARSGLRVVGVPKTIDNDLQATDQTFGFDTALQVATDAVDRLHSTAESHDRVMVLEVMGRGAGWIALHSGIAGGADVILIPEIPFRLEAVAEAVCDRYRGGHHFSIVVVAEGAAVAGHEPVYYRTVATGFEKRRLGGIGQVVGDGIEQLTGVEARVTTLGHVQRGGSPTPFDRILATRLGVHAARLAMAGEGAVMAALKGTQVVTVPMADAVARPRRVDPLGQFVQAARAIGIAFGT